MMSNLLNSDQAITTVTAEDGQILSVVGDTYRLVITGEQTGGAYAAIDMRVLWFPLDWINSFRKSAHL